MATLTQYINVNDASQLMGMSVSRVRQLLRSGDLDGVKITARTWLVDKRSAKRIAAKPHKVGRPRKG